VSKRRRDTKWLDQLRAEAIALVNKSNSKFRPERQVTRQAALAVVDRSLAYTSNSSQEIRSFSALRALSSFISLATISKATVSSLENSDLLPIGHPFSTAPHAMSASALRSARAQWVASDPLVDDSIRALVASAHSLEPGSIERQHAFARLIAAGPQLVPITAAIDIGDVEIVRTYTPVPLVAGLLSFVGGNSRAARSMRAKLQRRDRYGRFAFMGGGFSFKMKMVDGSFRSFSGRVVGRGTEADANSGLVEVELMRGSNGINVAGQIVKVPSNKGTAVKAIIPQEGLEGLPDQGEVQPDDVFVSGAQMIQSKTGAPDGWKPVKMAKDSSGKEYATQWESPDGYVVNGVGKYNHTEDYENVGPGSAGRATHRQPQLQPARQELDFVDFPAVDTWADVEDVISRDQNDYEADLKKYNSLDGDDAAQKAWVAEQEAKGRKNAADKPQILREESDSFAEQLQDAVGDDKGIRFNVNGQDVALKPTEVTDTSVKGTDENGEEREIKLADIQSMSEEASLPETPTGGNLVNDIFDGAKGKPASEYSDKLPENSEIIVVAGDGDVLYGRNEDGSYYIAEMTVPDDEIKAEPIDPSDSDMMEFLKEQFVDSTPGQVPSVFYRGAFVDGEHEKKYLRSLPETPTGGPTQPKPPSSRVSGPLEPGESGPGWTAYGSSKLSYSHQPNTDSVYSAHTITERVGTDGSTYEVWRMGWGVANQAYGDNINVARGLPSWNDAIDAIDADMVEVNKINAEANEKAAAAEKAAEAARYIPLGDRGAPGDKNPVAGITETRWIKQSGNVRMSDGSQTIYFDEEDGDGIYDAQKDGFRIVSGTGGGSEQREVPKYRPSTGVTRDLLPFESRQQLENAINAVISKGDNIRFKYGAKDIVFQPSKIYDNKKNGNRNVTGWSVTDGDERTYNVDKISAMPEASKAPQAAEAPIDAASAAEDFVYGRVSDTEFLQKIRGLEEAGEISSDQAQKIGDVVADYDNGGGDLDKDDLFSTLNNIISGEVSQEPDTVDFNSYTDPLVDLNRRRVEMAMDKKQKLRVNYKGKDRIIDPQRLWVNPKTGKELVTALDMSDGGKEKNFFVDDLYGPDKPSGQIDRPVLTTLSDEEIANAQQNATNFREKIANDPDFKKFVQDSPRNTGVQQLLDTYESKPQEGPVDLTSIDQDGLRSAIEGAIASGKDVSFLYHEKPRVVTPIEITVNPKNNRPKLRGFEYAADAEKEFFLDKFAKPVDSKLKQTELDDIVNLPQEDLDQIVDALWPAPAAPAAQPVARAKETGLQEIDTKGSTAVNRAAYDPQTQDLFIQFGSKDGKGGGIYKYSDVPQDFVDRFAAADSLGKMIPELKKSGKSDKVDEFPATGAAAQLAEDLAYRRAAAREFFTALSKVMEVYNLDFEDLFGLGVEEEVERGDRGLARSAINQFDEAFNSITSVFTMPMPQSDIDEAVAQFFSKYKKAKKVWVRSLGEAFDFSRTGRGDYVSLEDYEYDQDLAEAFKSDPSTLIEGMRRGPRKFIFDIGYAEDVEETIRRYTEDYGFTAELTGSDWHGGYPGVEVTVDDSSIASTDLANMLGLSPEDYAAAQKQGDKMLAGYRVDLPDFYAEGGEDYVQNQQDVDQWTSKNAVQVEARFVEPGVVRFFGSPEDLRDAIAIAAGEDRVDELMANVYRERPSDEVPASIPGEIDDSQTIESTDAPSVFSEAVFDDAFPAVGEGFYKINIFDRYVPKGAADDVQSSDYTDDPAVLANKYSAITLLWALKNAISPDEETGAPATGYGLLKFDKADEYVSAEAIYDAVSRLGIGDVEVILAGIYDAGVGGEENTDRALERSAIRARDAANAPIDSFSKSIIDMTDSSRSSQIDQAKILNGMLANPDSASRVVRSLENFVEPNDKLVDIADRLMWIQDNDPDEQSVNMGTFLDQYLPLATSPSDTDRDAFRGVWGMLMSTDGGDSIDFEGLTDSDDHFRARVFQALVRAEGSELAAQDAYEELIGAYGGYPEFVIGRQRLADGEDDLNSKTTAAAFARLVAAAARPNVEKLYRYVGVSKDNSALLDMYITKGSVFDMDPRSFTSSDVTKGDPEQQDSRNKGFDRVYFVLEPGDGMTVSAHHISPFENEKEHFGYGTFEVLSVESSFIKLGSIQEKHIVRIKQVSSRGQNTDYEPTTENLVPDYGDISMWKEVKVASQAGSNEGGYFKDPYGKKYYIKKGRSQSHVDNETLATAFYNELGLPSPAQGFGMRDGELYLVSPIISDEGNFRGMLRNEEFMSQVRDGFAVDAWLSNYDVTGMEYDNIVPGSDGQPFRIDNGGALRWRATGGSKPWFDEDVTELDTMRDPDLARIKAAAVVFGGMTEDDVARSARRLLDISPSRIIDMVASAIKDPDEAREVSRILIARREQILSRYGLDTVNPDADILGEPTSLATSMGYAARDLQPEDITAGDSFTIERVFHDADTPKGKISVEGYFPGHETQRKEWNEGTVIDVFRGAPIPPKGDKPALHRPKRPFEPKAPAFTGSAAELIDGASGWEEVRERLRNTELVFFDYETTGFPDRDKGDFSTNQPVQLGAVRVVNGEVVDRFNMHMSPGEPLGLWSRENLKRDGGVILTDEWLSEQPGKDDVHRQFTEWAGENAIFGAHNAPFDIGVFNGVIADAGIDYTPAGVIDTLKLSQQFMPSKSQKVKPDANGPLNHKLKTLVEFFGGTLEGWHSADADAEAVGNVLDGIIRAINDKPLPDLAKDAQKYERDKENFDRAKKEYAQALLDYETAKAVAAAWNCGGGGIKASGDPYGEDCNVPSIDDIIKRATPDESDFVDPDGLHSGPTDGSSSPLPDRGADDLEDYIIPFPESVDPADLFKGEKFTPTLQQQNIIAAWLTGEDVVVLAKAGTGKTTTLTLGARVIQGLEPSKRLLYIAYNRSVADEASAKFPPNTVVKTSDAVAYNFMRLQYPDLFKKFKSDTALFNKDDIAKFLGLSKVKIGDEVYEASEIASMVQDTVFKFEISSNPMLNMGHVFEADVPSELSDVVFSAAQTYWSDILNPDGKMPFAFNEMKKLWSMSKPDFSGTDSGVDRSIDVVMLDEAQDTNDAVGSVVLNQSIQVIMVGDPDQAIYQFNGAKDQLQNAVAPYRLPLTESWRYGPEIGGFANRFLALKERVHGVETNRGIGRGPAGQVLPAGTMTDAEAVIVRSNAGAFKDILVEIEAGRTVGVTKSFYADLKGFIEAAEWLKAGGASSGKKRPVRMPEDLRGFRSWKDVAEEAAKGEKSDLGTKTGILIEIVEEEGIEGLYDLLGKIQQIESVSDAKKSMGGDTGTAARSEFDLPDELGVGAYGQLTDGISFSIDPVGVIITGKKTFPYKETLKKVADWNGKSKVWKISASTDASRRAALEKLQNLIRDLEGYGSTPEARAGQGIDVVVSTAHQMKGLEFGRVRVGTDFRGPRKDKTTGEIIWPNISEFNLAYVTATRAINALDPGSLDWIYDSTSANDESSFPELAGQEAEVEAEEQDATPVPEVTDESGDGGAEEPPAITTAPGGDGPSDDEQAVYDALDTVFYAIQDAADTKGNKDFGAKAGINALIDMRKKLSVIFSGNPALNDLIDETITGIETKKFSDPEDGVVDAQKKLPAIFGREAAQEPGTVETAQDDSADIVTAPDMPSVDEPMTDEQVSEVVEETPQLVEAGSFNLEFIRDRFAEVDNMFNEAASNMKRSLSKDIVADVREGVNEVLRDLVAGNITLDDAYEKLAEVADSVPEVPLTSKNPDAAEIEALRDYVNSIRDAIEEVKYGRRLSEHLPPPELLNKVGEPMGTSKNGILIRRGMRVRDKNGFAGRVLDYNKTDWLGVFVRFDLDPREQGAVKKGNWGPGVARMIRTASTLDVIGEDEAPWADVRNDAQKKKDEDKGNDPRPPSFDQQLEIYNNMIQRRNEETWSGEESDRSDDDDDDGGGDPDGGGTGPTPSDDGGGGGNFPKVEAPQGAPEAPEDIAELARWNKVKPIQDPAQFLSEIEDDLWRESSQYAKFIYKWEDNQSYDDYFLDGAYYYTGGGAEEVNSWLAGLKSDAEGATKRDEKWFNAVVKTLDKLISLFPKTKKDMLVYRGVDKRRKNEPLIDMLSSLQPGDEFNNVAYSSTSIVESVAQKFKGKAGYLLEIVVPKGSRGFFVDPANGSKVEDDEAYSNPESFSEMEAEFILPRNTVFKVISREGDKIKVVVVPKEKDKNKTEDLSSASVEAEAPEALTTKDLSLIQDQVDPKFLDPQKTPQKDDGDELISAQELMGLPAENAYGLSLLDGESEEYLNNQRESNAYGLNQRVRSEGVFTPIIVREWKDGTRSVYDGHHRLIAAFDNNPDFQVPVVIEKVDSNFEDEFYSAKPKETLTPVKNTKKYQEDLGEIYDNALGDDVNDANAAAMRLYQEDPNMWVATNYRLRGTKPASRIEEEHNVELSDLDTIIKAFDEEIDKVPGLPINTLLYRGTRNRSAEKLFSLAVGEEFTDLGFVSTSLEYDTAEMFSRDVDVLSGVILEIEAPAGTKGISLAAYFGDTVDTETEVVLARGTTFVVKSKTDATDGDSRKMRIAIIDQTTSVEQEPVKADEDNVTYNDIENWTKVGPKKGSNEGGTFRDQNGNDYYVKEPRSTLHAQNEALAAALYKELQVPAVEVLLGEKNGELRTVSPIVESIGVLGYNPERSVIEKLQEGFAVDAWLANWDIAGLTFDNVIIDKDGNPIRVDPGGALMWRAQGEPKGKMFGDVVGEIDTLRSESKAPEASVIFGDMTDDQVKESAKVLLNISPERIDEIVDSIISDFADAADLKMKLRNRRQSILDRFGLTDADKLDEPVEETPTEEQVPDNSTEMVTTLGADVSMPNVLVEGRGAAPDHTPRDKELVARLVAEGPQAMGSQFVENWAKLYEEYDGSDTEAKDAAMFMWEMNINSIENRAKTDELVQNAVIGIFASTMSYIKDTLPPAPFSGTGRPQLRRDLAEWREDFPTDLVQKDRLSEKAFWTDLARYFDTPELIDIEMTPASAFLRILRAWEGSGNPPQEYDRFLSFYDKKITDDDHPLKYMLTPGQEVVLRPSSWTNADELTNFDEFLSAAIKGSPSDYEDYEQVGDQISPLEVGHVVLRVAVDSAYAIDQLSHVKSEKESIIPNGRYRVKSVERVNESLDFDDNEFIPYTRITLEVVPLERKKKAAPSEALAEAAGELGVNIDAYYDEALDIDDVEQATNKFSLAKTEHMTASDAVIIKPSDEGDLIAMIEREFGPFRGAYALPGGMLDAGETFAQAADREMQEEVGFDAANAVSRKNLGSVTDSPDWDPRFVNGVSVGAVSYVVPDGTELTAQDDARAALWVPIEDLANGIYPIAFGHAAWLAEHYKDDPVLGQKFEVIVEASKERNSRLIEKINKVREELGEPTFTQYGKDAPWWSPVAAVEETTEDLNGPLQLDYKEWRGGSITYVDEAGVTVGIDIRYDDVYALKNGSLEPPALPFFVPLYSSGAQDSGEGYYFAKSGKRYWGRYGAAGALLRRVKEDGTLEYLLAKRSANISAGGGQWAWPGGAHKDKKHAQSPQLTAYEELKEELGVYPEGIDPIATHTNFVEPDWQYETMIVDVTNNSSLTDSLKISDDENSDLGWFTEDDIRDLNDNGMLHPAVASSIEQVLAISRVYDSPLELPVYEPKEQPEMVGAQKITQTGRPKVTPENPLPLSASAIDGTYSVMDAIHHVKNSDDIAVSTFVDGGDIEDLEVRASIVVDEPTGEKKLSLRFKLTAWAADRLLDPIRFVRNNNKEDVINPAKRKALKLSGDLSEAEITEKPVMPAQFYVDPASGTVVRTGGPAKIVKVSAAQADTNRPVIYEGSILVIDDSKGKTGAVYEIVDEDGEEFFVPDYNIPIQERPYAHDESAVSYDNTVRIYLPLDATEDQIAAALRAAGVQDVRAGTNEDLKVIAENRLLSIFKQYTDPAKNVEDQQVRDELLDSIKKTENVTVDDIEFRISDTGRVEMMFSEEKAKELAQRLEIDRFEHEVPNMRAGMMYYVDNPNIMFGGISAVPREYTATAAAKSILRTMSANRLNSTMTRLLEGNQDTGLSSDSDIKKGSADYVFTTPMNVKTSLSDFTSEDSAHDLSNTIFVFSAEKLLRRLDIYGNREDQFGQRFNNHDIYAEIDLSTYRSAYEAMFKHDVDFGEYLTYISVAEDIRNEILDMLSQSGITTMYGIPVEELFVVHGDVPNRERIAKQIAENADLVEDIEQKQLSMGANPLEFRAFTNVVAKVWDFESDTGTTWFMPAPDGSKILGLVRPGSENPTMDIYVQEPSGGLYLYSGSDAESLTAYDMTTEYMRRAVSKSGLTHTLSILDSNDSGIEKFFTYMYGTEDNNVFSGFSKLGISKFDLPQYVPAGVINHYLSEDTWRESLNNLIEWYYDDNGTRKTTDISMSTVLASWAVSNMPIEAREALETMIDTLADGIRPVVSAGTPTSAAPSYVSSLEYFIETGNIIGGIAGLETTYNSGEKTITVIYTVKRRVLEKEDGKIAIVLAVATDNGTRLFELKEPTDLIFNKKTGIGTFSTASAQYRIQPLESVYAEHDNETKKNRQAK
jgi:ADP-ribose pyrophosphatase YjhB (NUDIX family)/DNA polymerase III epsilon subunit-like protein